MSPEWVEWIKTETRPYHIHISNRFHREVLQKLNAFGSDFIDWGFGSGYFSIALANMGNRVQGYEIERELVEFAEKAAKKEFMTRKGKLSFTCDMNALAPADVVYSDGLFEHYPDSDIVKIVEQQIELAKKLVVFNLPTSDYPWKHNAFGNERWLTIAEWEKIFKPFKRDLVELYRYGSGYFLLGVIKCPKEKKEKRKASTSMS